MSENNDEDFAVTISDHSKMLNEQHMKNCNDVSRRHTVEDVMQLAACLFYGAAAVTSAAASQNPISLIPHPAITFGIAVILAAGKLVDFCTVSRHKMTDKKALSTNVLAITAAAAVPLLQTASRALGKNKGFYYNHKL